MVDVISEHSSQHVAMEVAINRILPCAEINIVQSPKYRVMSDNTIDGNGFRVECVKKAADNLSITLSWDIPTAREDGTALLLSEIKGYEILVNDVSYEVLGGSQTTYVVNGLKTGEIRATIRTVLNDDQKSVWAELVTVEM